MSGWSAGGSWRDLAHRRRPRGSPGPEASLGGAGGARSLKDTTPHPPRPSGSGRGARRLQALDAGADVRHRKQGRRAEGGCRPGRRVGDARRPRSGRFRMAWYSINHTIRNM